ncbi:MAG: outer membrane beta-barrel protein [Acidobacteria bacterium]|nr:outer membrane beta-barrel protein [Acidobacteriota bacterium]
MGNLPEISRIGCGWIIRCAILIGILSTPMTLAAQDNAPKIEIFGGFSLIGKQDKPYGFSGYSVRGKSNLKGWNVTVTGNLNKWIGAEADFAGYSGTATIEDLRYFEGISTQNFKTYTYLFGPRLSFRHDPRVTPFLHSLFGGVSLNNSQQSFSGFAFALGGGFDINVARYVAIRAIQADFMQTRLHQGSAQEPNNSSRLSFGVVVRF